MKLSTAMRRGSAHQVLRATAVGAPQSSSFDLTSCVLGPAWLGLGHPASDLTNGSFVLAELSADTGVDLLSTIVSHPVTGLPMSLGGAIVSLDTIHGWTPDEIIPWLTDLGY